MGRSKTGSRCLFVTSVSGNRRDPLPPASTTPFSAMLPPDVRKVSADGRPMADRISDPRLADGWPLGSVRSATAHHGGDRAHDDPQVQLEPLVPGVLDIEGEPLLERAFRPA